MKTRCGNPKQDTYASYGARGITYPASWAKFASFLADMGPRPDGCTLDRINGSLSYSKDNCRWATTQQQQANRRNTRTVVLPCGTTRLQSEVAAEYGIPQNVLSYRLARWPVSRALSEPVKYYRKKSN
jgi:hypothetical protein